MKFCQKCGKELLDDAVICTGCGCAVHSSENRANAQTYNKLEQSGTNETLGIVSIIVGAIGIPFSLLLAITGYMFGGAGLAMAIIASKKNPFSGKAKIGLILSIITLSCAFVNSLIGFLMFL